jgi:hypothetical protein
VFLTGGGNRDVKTSYFKHTWDPARQSIFEFSAGP